MAITDRYTGKNLVVEFLPTGGTEGTDEIVVTSGWTSFSFERSSDMADVTAGNETARSYVPTIEDASWSISFFDEQANSNYVELLPLSTGRLYVYPQGKTSTKQKIVFDVVVESYNVTYPFDDAVEVELSGKRTGAMISEITATVS